MPPPDERDEPQRSSLGCLFWLIVLIVIAWLLALERRSPEPEADSSAAVDAPRAPAAPADPEPPVAAAPEPVAPVPEPEPEAAPEPPPPEPPPPPIVLRVTSDIDGADVFIDRVHVGVTPFETHDVEPGRRRINVIAAGYESHAEEVEIGDDLTSVTAAFRLVRLDERIAVVHRHRFGDCEGELLASTTGIAYRTDDDDAFEVGLDDLEEFAVDYLEHNLRIKVRGGRTYNFTDRQENADALFVFHREVEEARERLARGDLPAPGPAGGAGGQP